MTIAECQPSDAPTVFPKPHATTNPTDLRRVLGLRVPVSVDLAERTMSVQSILDLTVGTIIEFEVPFDADLTLNVAGRRIGAGRAVKLGENFGLKITHVETVHGRIGALAESS